MWKISNVFNQITHKQGLHESFQIRIIKFTCHYKVATANNLKMASGIAPFTWNNYFLSKQKGFKTIWLVWPSDRLQCALLWKGLGVWDRKGKVIFKAAHEEPLGAVSAVWGSLGVKSSHISFAQKRNHLFSFCTCLLDLDNHNEGKLEVIFKKITKTTEQISK